MDEKKPEPTKLQTDYTIEKMQNEIDRLAAELAEAQKKPEPGEFNTTNERSRLAGKKRSELTGAEVRLLEACKEIDRLTAENEKLKNYGDWHSKTLQTTKEAKRNIEILYRKRGAELKAKDEEIVRLQPFERFYRHIYQHLKPGDEVICKICGKSMDQIEQSSER